MLTKMVNGVSVVCSPEEEAAIRAEWDANAAMVQPPPKKPVDAFINDPLQMAALKAALSK